MKIHKWNPQEGDAFQGDVMLFRVPKDIKVERTTPIKDARDAAGLILAEGELSGHHHRINKDDTGTAELFSDPKAMRDLRIAGHITDESLGIGFLVVKEDDVVLSHDEHDPIQIPPGTYYVGGQREVQGRNVRRVVD